MRLTLAIVSAAIFLAIAVLGGIVFSPARSAQLSSKSQEETSHLSVTVYEGWRASKLLGSPLLSLKGEYLGEIRNAIVADNGQICSLLVQGAGTTGFPDFIFQVPWARVLRPSHLGGMTIDFSDLRASEFGLFFHPEDHQKRPSDFPVTKVIGDYARLQAGQGYGYVSDLVFGENGRLLAVLISREASAGGGTFAFSYPGATGDWSPDMSYYGLPYVTADQANSAGLRVDLRKFKTQSLK